MGLKILFLSHNFHPFIGGIEVISDILAQAFTKAGHDVHLLTWSKDSTKKAFPFTIIRSPSKRILFKEHAWADLVFENNPCLQLAWPGIFFNRPSVVALHTWISRTDGRIGLKDRLKLSWWLGRARKVIAVSNALRSRSWADATIIGNPYRESDFKIMRGVLRTKGFVFLGRLVSDKGVDIAIQAIYRLSNSKEYKSFFKAKPVLTIIGEGPERFKLELLAAELGLSDNVHFTGALSGKLLIECLNQHRFLLVPSVWEEPFGVVVLEGMACGCIPIVSDGGGLPDAVGKAGLIFRRGDVDELVACIHKLINNSELEQQCRDAAINHLKAFHPDVVSKKYLEVIESAVN